MGYGRAPLEVSADGKYLYQFRDKVMVFDTSDFKVVERIELAKPELPDFEIENVGLGGTLDSISEPGQHVSLFNSSDSDRSQSRLRRCGTSISIPDKSPSTPSDHRPPECLASR